MSELDQQGGLDERERLRYVESFQKQLVTQGSEGFLAGQKLWFERNRERLAREFSAINAARPEPASAIPNPFLTHRDKTEYDSVFAHQIFTPMLERALKAAAELGYVLHRPATVANSPGVEPTAAALPSTDSHTLFIGHGTSSFCNYWAKVFAAVIYGVGSLSPSERTPESVVESIRSNPIMVPAAKLVLRYASSESLLGFGELKQANHLSAFRLELVEAMETFIVGHEVGHFILHEQFPQDNGMPPGKSAREMELECDLIGLRICSKVGQLEGNFSARHLVGPLLLFCMLQLCEDAKDMLCGQSGVVSESHPSVTERIRHLMCFARTDPDGMLQGPLEEALDYALILALHIKAVLLSVLAERNK